MTKAVLALLVLLLTGAAMSPAETTAPSDPSDLLTTVGRARWQVEDLGPQVSTVTVLGGAFGVGPDSKATAYAGLMGEPAQLALVDPETGARQKVISVEGAGGFYDMLMASDGNLYMASHPEGFFIPLPSRGGSCREPGKAVQRYDLYLGTCRRPGREDLRRLLSEGAPL